MKNTFLRLPFLFDESKLLNDLKICQQLFWETHFNQRDFTGEWTSIALRSASGEVNDIRAHYSNYKDTILLDQCSYFRKIMDQFECDKESVRLLALSPGSHVKTHRDLQQGYEYGFARIHIPITTNPHVSFCVDGHELSLKTGECWYANFHLPHSIENRGDSTRIHLILDCLRNDWTDKLFRKAGYSFEQEKKDLTKKYDPETKEKIVAELRAINTETSLKLVKEILGGSDLSQ